MSVDASKAIIPGHGTAFIAAANTQLPANPLTAFSLIGAPPTGYENLGHTSTDNLFAFSKDGGDKTVLDSYLQDAVAVIYASTAWSLDANPLQVDKNSLDMGFGGNFDTDGGYIIPGSNTGLPKCIVLYLTDGTGALLFYIPNTTVTLGDVPKIDAAKFFEIPLSASILSADPSVIPAADNGTPAIMKLFKSDLVVPAPVITGASPASQGAGSLIKILGSGFALVSGVTGVKIGGINAASYEVLGDGRIDAVLPAGTAGPAPVVVTNPTGASNSQAYTRI